MEFLICTFLFLMSAWALVSTAIILADYVFKKKEDKNSKKTC